MVDANIDEQDQFENIYYNEGNAKYYNKTYTITSKIYLTVLI